MRIGSEKLGGSGYVIYRQRTQNPLINNRDQGLQSRESKKYFTRLSQ